MFIKFRLAPHLARPGSGFWGWLALRLMMGRTRLMNDWAIVLLDIQPADHVLELGFGAGTSIARAAASASQGFVAGVDYSHSAVAQARKRNRAAIRAGRVDLRQGDVAVLPFGDATFDKAFCCGLIYYLPEPVAALREVWRVLKPGGRFVVMARKPEILAQNEVFMAGDFHRTYTGDDLLAVLAEAGFEPVWLAEHSPDATVLGALGAKA